MNEEKNKELEKELKEWEQGWEKEHDSIPSCSGLLNSKNKRDACNKKWAKKKLST